jgi:ACS family glucarate transporter-like MFS transporter
LLIFWLFVLSAVSYLDRVNISIAGSMLAADYHLSKIQLGWIFSAFVAGYALFQAPGGRLADKFGARRVLTLGVVWWGVFTAFIVVVPAQFAPALLAFIVIRFALGAGEAVIYPASSQVVSRWIPSAERGLANGWIFSGVGVGAGFAPPLVAYFMVHYGWRSSFLVCAVIGLLAGLIWYLLARDAPQEHPLISTNELSRIEAGLPLAASDSKSTLLSFEQMLKSKEVLALTLSYFTYGYVAWIFFSWFYIYLAEVRGLNLKASAFYSMVPFIAMAAASPIGGILGDRVTKAKNARAGRCGVAVVAMILTAVFLVLGSRAQDTRVAVLVLAGGAGALYFSQSSFWAVTAEIGGASSGSVSGFMNMGGQLGGMTTASLTPWIASRFGWESSFFMAAALCLGGALAWLFVDPQQRLRTARIFNFRYSENYQGSKP